VSVVVIVAVVVVTLVVVGVVVTAEGCGGGDDSIGSGNGCESVVFNDIIAVVECKGTSV
jgi:hypothetical protein